MFNSRGYQTAPEEEFRYVCPILSSHIEFVSPIPRCHVKAMSSMIDLKIWSQVLVDSSVLTDPLMAKKGLFALSFSSFTAKLLSFPMFDVHM